MKNVLLSLCVLVSLAANDSPSYEQIKDQSSISILTPALAKRKTAKIRLSNGMEAYLISDPDTDQSAASITVDAGSWLDPKEYPGLAHFLEHMLFMGNRAYPNEFEYMQFVGDHGGSTNAYTASDRTVYVFSINNDAFDPALDRFANFFIEPLFLPSCINRELHAVDQEHSKNIEHDDWRQYMIMKETGNPDHPNASFSTGNAATLSGIPQDALKKWYREHYSSNRMKLVVLSSLPLDTLTSMVVAKFSAVPNTNLPEPVYPFDMLSAQQKGHTIYIKPVRDLKTISLVWQAPKQIATDIDHKTIELVSYVLRSGAENSLLEQLKKEKLAENLRSTSDRMSKEESYFIVDIELTEEGAKKIDTVVERVFQTLARLKETGIPRYIFDEMKKMSICNYQYQSRQEAFEFIMDQASRIMYEKFETYPEKTFIPSSYDPRLALDFLSTLQPESCLFIATVDPHLTGVATTLKEKWMDAEYTIREVSRPQLTAWANAKPNPHIDVPPPNPFMPQNLALVPVPANAPSTPIILAQDGGSKVYFLQDKDYSVPECNAFFHLHAPLLDGSPKSIVLYDLFLRALNEKLAPTLYFAHAAGLNFMTYQKDLSATILFGGFSEKAPLLIKTVFQNLSQVHPTQDQFEIYKQSTLSLYDNRTKELPFRQAAESLSSIIFNDSPTYTARYKALKSVSYNEFISFCSTAFKKAYVEGMLHGNLAQPQAAQLWATIRSVFPYAVFPTAEQNKKSVLVLPEKNGPYLISQHTDRQGNGVILMLQEGPFSFERRAAQQVLSTGLQHAFFDTLRTKQQTAYIAKAWDMEVERQLFQMFGVQSSTHQPHELLARFELFIEEFNRHLDEKLPSDRFETIRSSLIQKLEMPPENLQAMTQFLDNLAFNYGGDFQWVDKRIQGLKELSYDQFSKITRDFLSRENLRRLAILMEGVTPAQGAFRYEKVSQDDVRGIGKFVSFRNSESLPR